MGCFHALATVNCDAVNIHVQVVGIVRVRVCVCVCVCVCVHVYSLVMSDCSVMSDSL